MNRRDFLLSAAAGATAAALSRYAIADAAPAPDAIFTLLPGPFGPTIDPEFIGLSYESAQLAHPEYFSLANHELIGFVRGLAARGILRIGGNTSEYAFWTPHASPQSAQIAADHAGSDVVGPDKGHKPAPLTQTTPRAIRNLREFLDATGWRAYYGLNLGKGTPEQAADEAAFVFHTLGDRLILFQIGNEADLYHHNGLRPAGYDYPAFAKDWQKFYDAIRARVPKAKFAGPDTAGTGAWVRPFAKQFHGQVEMLTSHYYAEGPASDPKMNIEHLLSPTNDRWDHGMPKIEEAMASSKLPFRLGETNSCYGGGKEGVSNTFASALWSCEVMLKLAAKGVSGINFHGGGYGWYAPIVGGIANGFVARPEYYGLLMFAPLLGGKVMKSSLAPANHSTANGSLDLLQAYAARKRNGERVAVILNKDAKRAFRVKVPEHGPANEHATGRLTLQRLIAPRLSDTTDVTLAAAPVGANGAWNAQRREPVPVLDGNTICEIPAGSAVVLTWE